MSPEYFDTLRIPLKEGRTFTEHDSENGQAVAVVNQAFAQNFSPHKDVIGRHLRGIGSKEIEIVGVVADVKSDGLDAPAQPHIYASIFQISNVSMAVFLRTRSDVSGMNQKLTQIVNEVDPELPVFDVKPMDELISASMARRRFSLFLMLVFAGVALLLATLGIYGVMAYLMGQRTQEFGIRTALGAHPKDILVLALRPGLVLTGTGMLAGLCVSLMVTRLIASLLFGVSAYDPVTFVIVPVVLGAVAVAACSLPAWRATRVSPVETLRF